MTAQWLRDASGALDPAWVYDAPWVAINMPTRARHVFNVRGPNTPEGYSTAFMYASPIGATTERNLLTRLFYGKPDPESVEMAGFARYYATRDRAEAQTAVNVLDAGGVGRHLTSVWLVGWGPQTICMASADGQPGDECALCVMDWRYAVRIANVDTVRSPERLLEMTIRATYQLPVLGGSADVRPVFYMNRDARNALKDSGLRVPEDAGVPIMLRGIPIREIDELRSDETRVP